MKEQDRGDVFLDTAYYHVNRLPSKGGEMSAFPVLECMRFGNGGAGVFTTIDTDEGNAYYVTKIPLLFESLFKAGYVKEALMFLDMLSDDELEAWINQTYPEVE